MKKNKNIAFIALVTALMLLLPWVAMQFSKEVNWNLSDFVVAGLLLFGFGLAYELTGRRNRKFLFRLALAIALAAALILVWLNLAVGLVGDEDNPINLIYFAVPVVMIGAALHGRLRPKGMARALWATALVQALTCIITLLVSKTDLDSTEILTAIALNSFFAALFITSARLFQRASLGDGS